MRTAALAAFPVALIVAGAVACGSSASTASSPTTNASTHVLHGAYVPVGSSTASAELRALVFYSDTGYFSYTNDCTGVSCRSQGSYVFDGKSDLALTDGTTHATRHMDFAAVTSTTSSAAGLVGGLVVSPTGTTLVDAGASGTDLLSTIIEALLNGILMALLGAQGDGGAGSGAYCDPIAAVIDCGLQGLPVQSSSNGSCSCGTSTASDASTDASTTITIPVTTTPAAPVEQTIPLAVSNAVATVQISLGGSAPITALLDTGSAGIWVAPGVIPAAGGTRSGTSATTNYGNKVNVTGTITTTAVTLGSVTSSMPLAVAEVTATSCVAGAACAPDVGGDPSQFLFFQSFKAVVGIGMRQPSSGVTSPMPYLGQNGQHVVSLGAPGATTGSLIVDPSDDTLAAFGDLVPLDQGANGGFDDTAMPFCFNSFCGNALFDSGESQGILLASTDDDFANLGIPSGSATVPAGTAVDIDVAGIDFGLTVGATPQVGVDSFRIQATGASNNLGIVAFRYLDFFYDDLAGTIGVAPKSP